MTLEFNINEIRLNDVTHVKRVLEMADEDGWAVIAVIPRPDMSYGEPTATVIWQRPRSEQEPPPLMRRPHDCDAIDGQTTS